MTSGTSSHSETLKARSISAILSLASKSPGSPSIQNTPSEISSARPEVTAVSRMCW